MTKVSLRTEIDCSEDVFWNKCILDEEFNRRLFLDLLKFNGYRLLESRDDGQKLVKRQEVEPTVNGLPGPLKKLLGDKLSYVEEGVFDRATRTYRFKVQPSALPDIEVKVFAVGGMAEERIATDLKHSYVTAAGFIRTFLSEKGL